MFSSKNNNWCTPKDLFDSLHKEFRFTLDFAATATSTKCKEFYTPEMDALKQFPVTKSIWCNPPYGRAVGQWVKKIYETQFTGDCQIAVMLLPARTDTRWFHQYILGKSEIRFIKGRLKFIAMEQSSNKQLSMSPAPFPSMIVIFGHKPSIYAADKLGKIML